MTLADRLFVILDDGETGQELLTLCLSDALTVPVSGDAEDAVTALASLPYIRVQYEKLDQGIVQRYLRRYGAWSDEELRDREMSLLRILWLGCLRVREEMMDEDPDLFRRLIP